MYYKLKYHYIHEYYKTSKNAYTQCLFIILRIYYYVGVKICFCEITKSGVEVEPAPAVIGCNIIMLTPASVWNELGVLGSLVLLTALPHFFFFMDCVFGGWSSSSPSLVKPETESPSSSWEMCLPKLQFRFIL